MDGLIRRWRPRLRALPARLHALPSRQGEGLPSPRGSAGLAAALLVAGAVVAGCGPAADATGGQAGFVDSFGAPVLLPADSRVAAPSVTATTFDGRSFDLGAYKGKVVVFNVWGSWCSPCRAEAPALSQVAAELAPKGVQFVGINTKDKLSAAEAFVRNFDIKYPNFEDQDGQIILSFRGALPPNGIPTTLMIDKQGRVAGRLGSVTDRGRLRDMLNQLADEQSA